MIAVVDSERISRSGIRITKKNATRPSRANPAWLVKTANEDSPCWKARTDDDERTISSPNPSNRPKIARTRCSEVIGRSSQSFAARVTPRPGRPRLGRDGAPIAWDSGHRGPRRRHPPTPRPRARAATATPNASPRAA